MRVRGCSAWLAIMVCVALISRAHADEVRPSAPPATTTAPTPTPPPPSTTEPSAPPAPESSPPATSATPGLVIHEIPPPPPSYGSPTQTTSAPDPAAPAAPTSPPALSSPPPITLLPPSPTTATQDDITKRPGYRTHDGFFFRASLGLASTIAFEEQDGRKLNIGGLSIPLSLAVGGTLVPNLVLYGEMHVIAMPSPSVTVDDEERNVDRMAAAALSVGTSYYLMPYNVHFGGSIGVGKVDVYMTESDEPDGSTGAGLALRLVVGKEWWTGPQWAFGAAAHMLFMTVPDGEKGTLTLFSVGVSATATYN